MACDILRYDRDGDSLAPVAVVATGNGPPLQGLLVLHGLIFSEAALALTAGKAVTMHGLAAEGLSGTHLVRFEQNGARSVHAAPLPPGR